MLCVQRTGWGKSAVYFVATALLREQGAGPTLIVSPLLALMRNQIAAAERLGIRAHTINSTNRDAWEEVQRAARRGRGRPAADQPGAAEQPAVPRRDAAAVRRARRAAGRRRGALHLGLGARLPAGLPADGGDARAAARRASRCWARRRRPTIAWWPTSRSSSRSGTRATLRTYRGPLGRSSLRLEVVELPGRAERLAWLATWLPQLEGSGIVYTLTKRDAELVAEWLTAHGDRGRGVQRRGRDRAARRGRGAAAGATSSRRSWPRARWAWATTSPTSASSCTTRRRARSSPTTSRSGAPGAASSTPTWCCCAARRTAHPGLLHRAGVPAARARRARARGAGRRGRRDAARRSWRRQPRPRADRGDAEGARRRGRGGAATARRWVRRAGADWTYDAERYAEVTALRRSEQAAMAALRRRRALPHARAAGGARRSRPAGLRALRGVRGAALRASRSTAELVRAAALHLRSQPLVLEVKKMAPDEDGAMRKLPEDVRAEEGRALARLGDGGWDPAVQAGRRAGRFDDELVDAAAELRARLGATPARAGSPPCRRSAAARSCRTSRSGSPTGARPAPTRTRSSARATRPPQREMANAAQQVANVRGAFARHRRRSRPGRACSSTTCASAAGRSRWSAASCAAAASRRSIRSRSHGVLDARPSPDDHTPPEPVARLLQAANDHDTDGFLASFTEDGVVEDWGREFAGAEAIRGWSDAEFIGGEVTLAVSGHHDRGRQTTVRPRSAAAASTGRAPSPSRVRDDRVARITIRA